MTSLLIVPVLLAARYDPLSLQSLYLNAVNASSMALSATGFIVEHESDYFLITNLHVFEGTDFYTGEPLYPDSSSPEELHIWYHGPLLGDWQVGVEILWDDNGPIWFTHPWENIDAAALPLSHIPQGALLHPLNLESSGNSPDIFPGVTLFIVGFPYGRSSTGKMPIWKTAHMASEYDLDVEGARAFLIDATTREGMSGAPVVYRSQTGETRFMGIYSAQYIDAEIGMVWRPEIITEILESIEL